MIKNSFIWFACLMILFQSCEEEFSPDQQFFKEQLVVECIMENGNTDLPVYALVTNSFPFFSSFGIEQVNKAFVHDAEVIIKWDGGSVKLDEFCLSDLPEPIRNEIIARFGFNPDSVKTNFCAYIDFNNLIKKQAGTQYTISVKTQKDSTSSISVMPTENALDSIWFEKPPGKPNDSFAQMYIIINDPVQENNFYRYYTGTQSEPLVANFNSVIDDPIFNGKKFKTSISKALAAGEEFNENSGLFLRGDTAVIKWCSISHEQFEFWTTLETSRARQGPFASYVRIKGNMKNALGIFGLQSCKTYSIAVPK